MKKIAVVSTDTNLIDALKYDLPLWGFEMKVITSSQGIFNQLNKIRPDVLIIDFILDDINGGALCHQIKCDPVLRELPVILLSEYPALEQFSAKFGCNAVLKKPFQMRDLLSTIIAVPGEREISNQLIKVS